MKTYECIAHSGATGKQIVLFIRAYTASNARAEALIQAREQFARLQFTAGSVTIISVKEV
jgi:hypothetical protein